MRTRKAKEDGGGTSFADYVWRPVVLIEMKKRGVDVARHREQADEYYRRCVPNQPRYVVLCNFDEPNATCYHLRPQPCSSNLSRPRAGLGRLVERQYHRYPTLGRDELLIAAPPITADAKSLGAFYTPPGVAEFLVGWAVRAAGDVVVDTSSGGGVFLKAAADRVRALRGDVTKSVIGVEIDADSHRAAVEALAATGLPASNVRRGDFFALASELTSRVDAVVGNPPFIRYQQFKGVSRTLAARLMSLAGVRVSELASSWAPFVVSAAAILRDGGRLAMVVPMELCHAGYALPVLSYLARAFRSVQFLSFDERLFPDLSQDTLLLLADGKGEHAAEFYWKQLPNARSLDRLLTAGRVAIPGSERVETSAVASGRRRLIEQFLPKPVRELYAAVKSHAGVRPLGALAEVGIGYVTGANEFFHLSPHEATDRGIGTRHLRKAVFRGKALAGLRFTERDWDAGTSAGHTGYLLWPNGAQPLPAAVGQYVREGEREGVHLAYKCRVRTPWYAVPHVKHPDAFLTYMSGDSPVLVANETDAVAPNTLHVVRMLPIAGVMATTLAMSWQSSLTMLSAEIEGHAMGGGLLKLEPSEAGRVLLAVPAKPPHPDVAGSLDVLARHASPATARATVDRMLLRDELGLTESECKSIRVATDALRDRRYARVRAVGTKARKSRSRNG